MFHDSSSGGVISFKFFMIFSRCPGVEMGGRRGGVR